MAKKKPVRALRDANDWRIGDVVVEGPNWADGFGVCYSCGKPHSWDEYWQREKDPSNPYRRRNAPPPVPIVQLVRRKKGNVVSVALQGYKWFTIGPRIERYIINPACINGGYRETNSPDPKYATDSQGRFISTTRTKNP